ncbi:MAG: bifunctional 3-phenylpropionate/cinnamic acid dioxygenase ferredoxin subunit [Comamonadaceae bacterium]|nr:MAG: bifunctional 3-phenylpropionate/cinnamic acid dioxygenase ferredoxin subunit [Comamonadaceae bacterium]
MSATPTAWVRVCAAEDLEEGEGKAFDTNPPIAVFLTNGELFCIDDTCTHEKWSLGDGWVDGCQVECTLHMARFDLRTGNPLSPPASRPVRTHDIRMENGAVLVQLPETYHHQFPEVAA